MKMLKLFVVALVAGWTVSPSIAATTVAARVVTTCGTMAYTAGGDRLVTIDITGGLCMIFPPLLTSYISAAATTNATVVKASAGAVYHISAFNNSGSIAYLKFYNMATSPTCASDTVVRKMMIPANTSGTGFVTDFAMGLSFSTGIAYCLTAGFGDTDNTAVAASAYIVNVDYR